jgi:membrane protease YdiL (CAAX protease family)
MAAALWTAALWLLAHVAIGVTVAVRSGAEGDLVNLAACEVLATSLVIFFIVRVHAREVSLRSTLGLRPLAPLHLLLSVAAGAGLFPVASAINDAVVRRFPRDPADLEALEKLVAVTTPASRVALVVTFFVVVPLAVELFFRGTLYGLLRRATSDLTAIVSTAVFFACGSSDDPRSIPTALLLGLALGRLRAQTATVLAPIAASLAYGAVAAIPILRGRDPNADVTFPVRWVVGGAVIGLLALVVVGAGKRSEG